MCGALIQCVFTHFLLPYCWCILIAGNVREDMVGMKGVVVVLALYLILYLSEFNDFAINIKVLL